MENLFGKNLKECQAVMDAMGEPGFRGKQLYQWLYEKKVEKIEDCTNFSKALRSRLAQAYIISHGEILRTQSDEGDGTRKFLIRLSDGECIESVLMTYHHGHSLCVSSQVGCAMGCAFCASTRGGLVRNLTAGEILDQIYLAEESQGVRVSNVVIMGIGEPLANYDEVLKFIRIANTGLGIGIRKFTLSTCGLVPEIERLSQEGLDINLAISLHSPFQERREAIMPVARRYPLKELIKGCKNFHAETGRRLTFEYAMIDGVNDRPEDLKELIRLFRGEPVHINLIGLNTVQETGFKGSQNVNFFCDELKRNGINSTIRRKVGKNIDAACGQLRQKSMKQEIG